MTTTFNRSALMKNAWRIAKTSAEKVGCSAREFIAEAMKMAWSAIKKEGAKMEDFEFTLTNGKTVTLKAEYKKTVQDDIVDDDGIKINVGKIIVELGCLTAYVDGKKLESSRNPNFWKLVDAKSVKKIWGLPVGFADPEVGVKYENWIKEVKIAGTTDEAKKMEEKKQAEKIEKKIKYAESIIKAAKNTVKNKDGSLMSASEAKIWVRNYNNFNNEGGEGYIPQVITKEAYENAEKTLREYKNK